MSKYNFRLRLSRINNDNEFVVDEMVSMDIREKTIDQIVQLLNLALDNPAEAVKNPALTRKGESHE